MNTRLLACAFLLVLSCSAAPCAQWDLAWEDSFDRAEVGDGWTVVHGKASIKDGRLLLEGGGATILTSRGFKPDVRVEFEAEADPRFPPCDLSAALASNPIHGYAYLLAFGGQSNQANQLLGPGVHQVDKNPPFVIEHGKVYHVVAQREGKRITYTVDGHKLLDAVVEDPVGGPGFDRVGLVTWAGMLVDNVRVLERSEPAPDTPRYFTEIVNSPFVREGRRLQTLWAPFAAGLNEAVEAFNAGKVEEAYALFRKMGNRHLSLWGQAWALGDLAYRESDKTGELRRLAADFRAYAAGRPDDLYLQDAARAAEWFGQLEMSRRGKPYAVQLVGLGEKGNPFYHKARLYEARYLYWDGKEGGDTARIGQAVEMMRELKALWPENTVLRQYTGENVPWGQELNADTDAHPAWAAYLREAYARQVRIMEEWFEKRQAPDGQLGGGWGDDVELMRTWMQVSAISTGAPEVADGIRRFADGIWDTLKDGYDPGIGDVEHSAEPSADSVPGMLLLRYGDPEYVERNMLSCRTVRDRLMGVDAKGYPRFMSTEIGSDGVNRHPRAGGDTGYHARAMKHFLWQAWWGDPVAKDWFVRWADGWRAATVARIDTKEPGLPPPTIWYPSGGITPPGGEPWWDPSWNYYGVPGLPGMVFDSILAAYAFSGERRFLSAYQLGMREASRGPLPKGDPQPPSLEWQRMAMLSAADPQKTSLYRLLTGERVYDEYTMRLGEPAQVYRADYDLDAFQKSFERAAKSQRHNLELQTTEVLSTDRAALGAALTVFGAYTGAVSGMRDAAMPTFAVTYETESTDFAALVTEAAPRRARVWLYNFREADMAVGLRFWRLQPGQYILSQGELLPGEGPEQHRYGWLKETNVTIAHRADGAVVTVPPGKVWVVDVRMERPITVPDSSPDLAVSRRDTRVSGRSVTLTVHNIGNASAGAFTVAIQAPDGEGWKTLAHKTLTGLAAPKDLTPSRASVRFSLAKPLPAGCRVVLDPRDHVFEICETNNVTVVAPDEGA